jgi:hypothetical protein
MEQPGQEPRPEDVADFHKAVRSGEPLLIVLKAHLLAEAYLNELLTLRLPRPQRLLDSPGGLNFARKLSLVEAMELLPDNLIEALRKLNHVRNDCVHKKDHELTAAHIDLIGAPLRERYWEAKGKFPAPNEMQRLPAVVMYVSAGLAAAISAYKLSPGRPAIGSVEKLRQRSTET